MSFVRLDAISNEWHCLVCGHRNLWSRLVKTSCESCGEQIPELVKVSGDVPVDPEPWEARG